MPRTASPSSAAARGDREDRLAPIGGVAHDALADPLAAELELGLDHGQDLAAGRQAVGNGRQRPWSAR